MAKLTFVPYAISWGYDEINPSGNGTPKPHYKVVSPLFETEECKEFLKTFPILKRISIGPFTWTGDAVPNDAHFWGRQDFLSDPQFQGENEVNYFRKTNTDLVTFLQTEGWICLVRIRKVLRMLHELKNYESTMEGLSLSSGQPLDAWGTMFEKMHRQQCRCSPCCALHEVKKQLDKKNINMQSLSSAVIMHVRRCVYRVLTAGIDRIFETFCNRRFSLVWYILYEEFDDHYRDTEFEKLSSLIMNDVIATEPITSLISFSKTLVELYDGTTDLACALLHKFAVILGSQKLYYTTSMNFIMFYIDSFNMLVRMLRWMETKFKVFNHLSNGISSTVHKDKLDFKTLILHAMFELVYSVPDVYNTRVTAMKVIGMYQNLHKNYFGPSLESLKEYMECIDNTLIAANNVFENANLPCKCPTLKVPTGDIIDAALYINPYRDDQFETPQVFQCYFQERFIIERSQTPWKLLYNSKTKILLRLTVENPCDKNKKLAINIFVAEDIPTSEGRVKDQYFALYEARLERLAECFHSLAKEIHEYYGKPKKRIRQPRSGGSQGRKNSTPTTNDENPESQNPPCQTVTKISVPVKLKRTDKRSLLTKRHRVAELDAMMIKYARGQRPSVMDNFEQLLTFAVKTGIEGAGMLSGLAAVTKDVYLSLTCIDREKRAKADTEFSLNEMMSFIIFWYAKYGCLTEFECQTMARRKFECGKSSLREKFPLLYKAAEELDVECFLSENDLALLDKTLTGNMSEEEFKRCKKGLETSIFMNEVAHSKRTFAKLASSGFCVTQRGEIVFAEGSGTVRHEETTVTGKKGETLIKCKSIVKPQEVVVKNRVKKSTDEGQTTVGTSTKTTVSVKVQQQPVKELPSEPVKPPIIKKSEDTSSVHMSRVADVDALVELIEGTHIKTSDPKKAAKKARQKEKKEQERQRIADELAKEERKKKLEELRQLEIERKLVLEEQRRLEEQEKKEKAEVLQKQKQAADMKKEEQRRKREDVDRRKAEEKKLKKDAKKQRREQRKRELESPDGNEQEVETKSTQDSHEPVAKTEPRKCKEDKEAKEAKKAAEIASEKDFGRIKHEKEQRKREEEEARRLEQLQAHERAQANKKNKKKKKKQKHNSESNSQSASDASGQGGTETKVEIAEAESQTPPLGAPILDLINANNAEAQGKGTECNNLVTIKKHMDSTVTISMKGKEGEKDLIYTLMNGQVYPTNNDGRMRSEDALPLQQTTFVKPETVRPNHVSTPPATISSGCYPYSTPMGNVKPMGYSGHSAGHSVGHTYPAPMVQENLGMGEIDLSQLKLPPGITITKVPQHLSGLRGEEMNMNGIQHPDYQPKPAQSMSEYARISSHAGGGIDARYNPNVMVVDSRCSSLESPIIGIRPSDTLYGANGTRPSSEASVASDRPNSGMDSLMNHNGMNPYAARPAFHSNEMLHARVPVSLSSPFASASRNETPSPAWPNEFNPNPNMNGIPGMIPSTSGVRTDAHGFWPSNPASPVAFPANNVSEILKAQDQQFKFRGAGYGMVGEGSSTAAGFPPDHGMIPQKTAQFKKVSIAPTNPASYAVGSAAVNGSSSPRAQPYFNSMGYRDVPIPPQRRGYDQWSPWDQPPDTSSPDASASPSSTSQSSPLMKPPQFSADTYVSWEPSLRHPADKQPGNRTVNPYGPIGSNISRRSSSDASNGISQNGKPAGPPRSNDSAFWSYNRTF
ncbi:unnamed protein product [Orchesella dallaii]|uniref:Uncharacterized protein n=1 Tax=Orchesella dallaii TaxID=48710 RepID=A0ABP1S0V4_9HEXA